MRPSPDVDQPLRHIRTARTLEEMNAAIAEGFRPLVKPIERDPQIKTKFAVFQNRSTGEIMQLGDYRAWPRSGWDEVIPWTHYYPYDSPLPFAAYLCPPDLAQDEIVVLEDLIEDRIGCRWNQGSVFRLESCRARWTGSDFELLYDPETTPDFIIG
jgi:hypothetical protein